MITNSWLIWGILAATTGFSIWASNNTKWGKFLGYVNVAIIIGAIISNVGILPVSSGEYGTIMNSFVPIGIVCMLFMADLTKLGKCGPKMIICMLVASLVFLLVAIIGAILFNMGGETWKVAAVAASYFTGNLQTAAGTASSVELSSEMMAFFNAAAAVPWVIYSLGCYMVGRSPIPKFLRSYTDSDSGITLSEQEQAEARAHLDRKEVLLNINETAIVIGAAVLIVGVGQWLGAVTNFYSIVFYATFGILVANFTPIRKFVINDYLATFIFTMYMVTCGIGAHYSTFSRLPWQMFAYVIFIYVVSIVVFVVLLKVLRLPWEMGLLAHMACVGGPIATPPLAKSYNWTDLVLPGIIIAVLGQVFGAYIGIGAGSIVRTILGG